MKRIVGLLFIAGLLAGCAGEKESTVKALDEFDGKGDKTKTSKVLDDQKKNREDALKKLDDETDKN
jgi:hypothetical protein